MTLERHSAAPSAVSPLGLRPWVALGRVAQAISFQLPLLAQGDEGTLLPDFQRMLPGASLYHSSGSTDASGSAKWDRERGVNTGTVSD